MPVIQENVEPLVEESKSKFPNDVIRVRYNFGEDRYGYPMLFYRVLLTDDAVSPGRLGPVTHGIRRVLWDPWEAGIGDHFPSVDFRGKSEQDRMRDPEWD